MTVTWSDFPRTSIPANNGVIWQQVWQGTGEPPTAGGYVAYEDSGTHDPITTDQARDDCPFIGSLVEESGGQTFLSLGFAVATGLSVHLHLWVLS